MNAFSRIGAFCAALGLTFVSVPAATAPAEAFPPDFDLRAAPQAALLETARAETAKAFAEGFGPELKIHWGDLSTRPLVVFRPAGVLGVAAGEDPVSAARQFLLAGAAAFGLNADEIDALDAATSFGTWDRLRVDQRLGRERAHRAMEAMVLSLLGV